MKLDNQSSVEKAQTSGIEQVTDFSINVSAQAFSILSSGLYKNPIRAIIRELSTNAVDSHTEAKTSDKPFDVEFPTKFAPLFRIRDYGTGLSKQDVLGLYSTYFSSTKTDSNEQIGALGLGSKSPLGYTNTFSVASYFKNKKTNFSVFIGDNGFPNIAVTGVSESKEPSGLEIIIPVKEESYYMNKWYDGARDIYQYFDVFPNIQGAEIEVTKPVYERVIGNIKVHPLKSQKSSNVIQGTIAYPLDLSDIDLEKGSDQAKILDKIGFDIYVDIGEVSFLPNREELSYDEKTKSNIKKHIELFIDSLEDSVQKSIDGIRTYTDAIQVFTELSHQYASLVNHRSDLKDSLMKKMSRWNDIIEAVFTNSRYYYNTSTIHYKVGAIDSILEKKFDKSVYFSDGKRPRIFPESIRSKSNLVFWVNDLKKSIISKFGKAYNKSDHSFLIPVVEDVDKTVKYIKRKFKVTNKQIRFTSELDFPVVVRQVKKGLHFNRYRLVCYNNTGYNDTRNWRWERGLPLDTIEHDMIHADGKIIWVETKSSSAIGFKSRQANLDTFLGGTNTSTWGIEYVHGVKSKDVKEIKNRSGWIHLDDYVKQYIERSIAKNDDYSLTYSIDGLSSVVEFARECNADEFHNIEIKAIIDILKNVKNVYNHDTIESKINRWNSTLGIENLTEIGIDFHTETMYNDGQELKVFIKENYPHLYFIADVLNYSNKEEVTKLLNDLYKGEVK